jgi:hypothetical protein
MYMMYLKLKIKYLFFLTEKQHVKKESSIYFFSNAKIILVKLFLITKWGVECSGWWGVSGVQR